MPAETADSDGNKNPTMKKRFLELGLNLLSALGYVTYRWWLVIAIGFASAWGAIYNYAFFQGFDVEIFKHLALVDFLLLGLLHPDGMLISVGVVLGASVFALLVATLLSASFRTAGWATIVVAVVVAFLTPLFNGRHNACKLQHGKFGFASVSYETGADNQRGLVEGVMLRTLNQRVFVYDQGKNAIVVVPEDRLWSITMYRPTPKQGQSAPNCLLEIF